MSESNLKRFEEMLRELIGLSTRIMAKLLRPHEMPLQFVLGSLCALVWGLFNVEGERSK